MRVHYRDPGSSGVIVTNPANVLDLVARSRRKSATVVLLGDDLAVNTISLSSHEDTMVHAGFDGRELTLEDGTDFRECVLRGAMNTEGFSLDIWSSTDFSTGFPYSREQLQELCDHIRAHPRMRRLPASFEIELVIHDEDCSAAFEFRDGVLHFASEHVPREHMPEWAREHPTMAMGA